MNSIMTSIIYILLSSIMLFTARILFDRISPFKTEEQIDDKNAASVIAFAGYLIGITAILAGAFLGPDTGSFKADLLFYLIYSTVGIFLMTISGFLVDKVFLNKFDCKKEILDDRNIGTAFVYFGTYFASGLIIAACVNGEYGGILSSFMYYCFGMVFLFIFMKIYDLFTPYSVHDELEKDNYAVGIALSGNIIAMGLILMKATLGDVEGLKENIILYLVDLSSIFLLLPAIRVILCNFIISRVNMNEEIKDGNCAAGILEFTGIICFALIIFFAADFSSIL